ncbi:TPA: Eco29kI family restriction endonuclease [Aeromonas veronii]|nr:Eco29kI family restriction endonuclease [Aeromonas veronii]
MIIPFNPLDKKHLGESVGQAMLRGRLVPLATLERFEGAGIYAIYYTGSFPAYAALSTANQNEKFTAPIYVGKAVPKGARKGGSLDLPPGTVLFERLNDHRKSIEAANNLDIDDFYCRFLVVEDIWIPLGESLLISKFSPIWNQLIDGFGNHDPGKGRHAGQKPRWDVLHPGRNWAERLQPRPETSEQIAAEAIDYLRNNPPIESND